MINLKRDSFDDIRENQEEILDFLEEEHQKINQKLDLILEILKNKFQIEISNESNKIP